MLYFLLKYKNTQVKYILKYKCRVNFTAEFIAVMFAIIITFINLNHSRA